VRFLHEDVENHHPPPGRRHVDPPGDPFAGPDPQLPQLAFEMPDVRCPQRVQADILDRLQKATSRARSATGRSSISASTAARVSTVHSTLDI
jgi:hypothetical protein